MDMAITYGLPASLVAPILETTFNSVYKKLCKKIPWYVFEERREQMYLRCRHIAERAAVLRMERIDAPFRELYFDEGV